MVLWLRSADRGLCLIDEEYLMIRLRRVMEDMVWGFEIVPWMFFEIRHVIWDVG